ncbi:MAG: M12 family metallo-peptidase [Rudaea sp.]|nr:M12 family metallo-peptidase [Rudaea sp.]
MLIGAAAAASADEPSLWQDRAAQAGVDTAMLAAPLHDYRALNLDLAGLRASLDTAPDESSGGTPVMLALPLPDGSAQVFAVYRTQVMAPQLAARYPQIRSYAAHAVDHPQIQARLDDSPHGFSAMIRGPDGVILVQPVALRESTRYISFRREALGASRDSFHCLVDDQPSLQAQLQSATGMSAPPTTQTTTGASVRTYRLALAATAEYTQFFGGTVADGMAAIVQAVNRVNGIYLTEFAVQFQLVNNNNLLVYTSTSSEPYTNNNGSAMLGQNQTNIDSVIGSANYDFGHVFSTGGGGIAYVGVACNSSLKAQGVTGSPQPTGDGFWVDYVAHEMGHQMGANHTFNTISGACGGGNRYAPQATEPGSGSTIMAYAGICSPSDLQPHSDPYFHAASLIPIAQVLAGSGATCGTVLAANNHAPVPNAGSDYTIPAQTPFQLNGSATDQENDPLTYTWEQMDLGTASPPETDDGTRPLFRSYPPTASPSRDVPELARILSHNLATGIPAGGDIPGETWAMTTRDLNFRLTVRDNHPGGGATATDDMIVHVTAAAGPFAVTAPLASVTWPTNSNQTVIWNVANTTAAPVSCTAVDVLYSSDGGLTFAATLASAVPNSGSANVIVPNLPTTTARIEVRCDGNIFFDISPGNFTIFADEIFKDGFEGN